VLGAIALAAVGHSLLAPPLYEYPAARGFEGGRWYNPYESYGGRGLRVNLHAHSRAWLGLTSGSVEPDALRALYRDRAYDVAVISNYQRIEPPDGSGGIYLPAYEHAMLPLAPHQTVLGARAVSWRDYPLWQSTRQRQHVIDRLTEDGSVLILNHPVKVQGYPIEDMGLLSGYHAIEIASKYGLALGHWDAALTAGRAVWGVASDDGHHQDRRASHIGIGWLIVEASERSAAGVLDALRAGRFHSVFSRNREPANQLLSARLEGGELHVRCRDRADSIRFVSEDGALRTSVADRTEVSYRVRPEDPYVRVEIVTGRTSLFLNPVIRQQVPGPPRLLQPLVLETRTLLLRGSGLLVLGAALALLVSWGWPRRGPSPLGAEVRSNT
jgi:hypothetical protein